MSSSPVQDSFQEELKLGPINIKLLEPEFQSDVTGKIENRKQHTPYTYTLNAYLSKFKIYLLLKARIMLFE